MASAARRQRVQGGTPVALQFVPVTRCRVTDTQLANGPFGGPVLAAIEKRDFGITSGACGIPPSAAVFAE
jgi:hypothetical protein